MCLSFNVLTNKKNVVLMNVQAGLSDLAFEQNWRIAVHNKTASELLTEGWLKYPLVNEQEFYRDYLAEEARPDPEWETYFEEPSPIFFKQEEIMEDENTIHENLEFDSIPNTLEIEAEEQGAQEQFELDYTLGKYSAGAMI